MHYLCIYVALYNLARLDTLPYVTPEVTDGNGQFDGLRLESPVRD